jgi:hypothetical protein
MLDLERLAKLRFGMSEVPKIGGQPGTYEEKWGQWFLERSFSLRQESHKPGMKIAVRADSMADPESLNDLLGLKLHLPYCAGSSEAAVGWLAGNQHKADTMIDTTDCKAESEGWLRTRDYS